ncbi:hypothetical protein [Amycolatopsis cihanbeyliensis]|uniref:hypothetical protein n=1 Tax=Amycolatopsis cihanbeyliensis TaxID=1128664 RepID=UPI00114DBB1F|nr:hypothetical protein [Amycolatopsis cihanbeyliensis]
MPVSLISRQAPTYNLTERAIQLVPIFVQLGVWGTEHLPVTEEYAARGEVLPTPAARRCGKPS